MSTVHAFHDPYITEKLLHVENTTVKTRRVTSSCPIQCSHVNAPSVNISEGKLLIHLGHDRYMEALKTFLAIISIEHTLAMACSIVRP
jgi:hypothetical protein